MEFEAYTIMRSENMKKIWIVAMTMCILLTGCGSKKQVKKQIGKQTRSLQQRVIISRQDGQIQL